jgi:hypothetical protein
VIDGWCFPADRVGRSGVGKSGAFEAGDAGSTLRKREVAKTWWAESLKSDKHCDA